MAGRKKQDVSAPPPKKPRPRRSPTITKADFEAGIAPLATKAELYAAIEPLATKAALEPLATKAELYAAVEPLATKAELAEALKNHPTHEQHRAAINEALEAWAYRLREVINQDVGRHIGAAMEEMRGWIRALDDKYSDLPGRVSAIEARLDGNGK